MSSSSIAPSRSAALLIIFTALLSFAPVAILAPAIGWPASLSLPATSQLTAIGKAPGAVQLGYAVYLLYSILIAPAMIFIAARAFGGLARPLAIVAVSFAALSALARCIGILRWLTVMPALSQAHSSAEGANKASIELVFTALNKFGGGIGELLGVSLFMAISIAIVCVAALRNHTLPAPLALLGLASAALLFGLFLPTMGVALTVPTALAVTVLTVWMLAIGGWMLWRPSAAQ
jgi:Domain of unknown function (DUF4386)